MSSHKAIETSSRSHQDSTTGQRLPYYLTLTGCMSLLAITTCNRLILSSREQGGGCSRNLRFAVGKGMGTMIRVMKSFPSSKFFFKVVNKVVRFSWSLGVN